MVLFGTYAAYILSNVCVLSTVSLRFSLCVVWFYVLWTYAWN